MLTLEQYRSPEMNALYQNYLGAGPIQYTRDLPASLAVPQPESEAALAVRADVFPVYAV